MPKQTADLVVGLLYWQVRSLHRHQGQSWPIRCVVRPHPALRHAAQPRPIF